MVRSLHPSVWSLKKKVGVSGTKHLVLEGGGLKFVADMGIAKEALGENPDLQAQSGFSV